MSKKLIISDAGTHTGPQQTSIYIRSDGRYQTEIRVGDAIVWGDVSDQCPSTSDMATDGYWRHIEPSPIEKLRARMAAQAGPEAMRRLANPL